MVQTYLSTLYDSSPDDRIFPASTKHILQHEMKRGCAASGVKRIRIHDLRHSHASLLIELGYSPLLIAERLGHEKYRDCATDLFPTCTLIAPEPRLLRSWKKMQSATILLRKK
ncbi:MAG: tyrosine-type recombinase/integrase [Oscillospiraceae bacterium]